MIILAGIKQSIIAFNIVGAWKNKTTFVCFN